MSFFKKSLKKVDNKRSNLLLNPYIKNEETKETKETKDVKNDIEPVLEPIDEPILEPVLEPIDEPNIKINIEEDNYNTDKILNKKIKENIEKLNEIKYGYTLKKYFK